ncbi:MAG: aquaporin Z [Nitrososphaerota archaeon]|jgi:aquaporin Z|uniref:aquaporin Z n=1 Tax=Candidatus Bathycorpusculum sp. TaxID=2994959 RepID=UPI0028211EDC|nr:aquaporin Z [Candidatus Termiticorpusculum sp.]MCL2257836.1 aquaporin Z [Candidatus Termiticorpusculum sp.]MCL2291875.1 aquaporin Z [Candidatus Termiticorpusculum sp.]MDR0461240.1 aquaporin Z [Nitrososphaerota archaeon]
MGQSNLEIKKYVAELIGTFILVFAGCGSAILAGSYIGNLGVSFAFGLSVLVMAYTIGSISGCHINPAVSISMLAVGKINAKDTVFYIIFQCIGAILGAGVLYGIRADGLASGAAITQLAQNGYGTAIAGGGSLLVALVAEIVCTFLFVLVIHGSLSKKAPKGFAGIAIGLALTLVHLVLIPITNASVNPARSLGPAMFVGGLALEQLWLFWVAPIVGGLLAAVVWKMLEPADSKEQTIEPT